MNRRNMLALMGGACLLPLVGRSYAGETIVPKGIRFLGKYPKTCFYDPNNTFFKTKITYSYVPEKFTPVPLSYYKEDIEFQSSDAIGYTEWELI